MNRQLTEQENYYRTLWLEPIEMKLPRSDRAAFDKLLLHFLDKQCTNLDSCGLCKGKSSRYIGSFEEGLMKMNDSLPAVMKGKASSCSPIGIYARFHSYVEEKERKRQAKPADDVAGSSNAGSNDVGECVSEKEISSEPTSYSSPNPRDSYSSSS